MNFRVCANEKRGNKAGPRIKIKKIFVFQDGSVPGTRVEIKTLCVTLDGALGNGALGTASPAR
jgi:hypothetical protein